MTRAVMNESNQDLRIIENGDHYVVGHKKFYTRTAAEIHVRAQQEDQVGFKYGKIFLFIGLFVIALIVFSSSSTSRYSDAFIEGGLKGLILTPVLALAFWLPGKIKKTLKVRSDKKNAKDQNYLKGLEEIENGTMDRKFWAKAYALSNGDESKAKALYIRMRAEELTNN
jgi:hypothetical protein